MNIQNTETSCITIYSMRLAGFLMMHGFALVELSPNDRDCKRNVFHFKNCNEIHRYKEEFIKNKDKYIK